FSAVALQKNYDLLRDEFMALEFPDARRGRAVAKTVLFDDPRVTTIAGIAHRGGAILETPGQGPADPAACPQPYNPTSVPPPTAFCTVQELARLERLQLSAQVTSMNPAAPLKLVYAARAPPCP